MGEEEEVGRDFVKVVGITGGRGQGKAWRTHRSCPEAFSHSGETGRYPARCKEVAAFCETEREEKDRKTSRETSAAKEG